ncbi:hypothetical protein A5732_08575 [Mycobacterium colombiense]|nr:hypothetical protein A5732_08575 [Mycobacterium colombiense]
MFWAQRVFAAQGMVVVIGTFILAVLVTRIGRRTVIGWHFWFGRTALSGLRRAIKRWLMGVASGRWHFGRAAARRW